MGYDRGKGRGAIASGPYADRADRDGPTGVDGRADRRFVDTDHDIRVQILVRAGLLIHAGRRSRGLGTAKPRVPGSPEVNFQTWTIDVSGFDLSRASRLSVVVGY